MNYMQQQYGNATNRQPPISPYPVNSGWNNNRIRPVSSIDEVKAASIDFDGSVFYFPDLANKKIYTKQINLDGTSSLNMYELKDIPVTAQPVVDTSNYITRQEFEKAMTQLRNLLPQGASSEPAASTQAPPAIKKEEPQGFVF